MIRRGCRNGAIYSELRVRSPFFIRVDGRGFGRMLRDSRKPYDPGFARLVVSAARAFMEGSGLAPILAYTFSDEVNLLFLDEPFRGRLEKLDSVTASYISSSLSVSLGRVVSMDARVIPVCREEILSYLQESQAEAWRNHVFSYGFYALVGEGKSHADAMESLRNMRESDIHEMLFKRGVNLARTPAWERRGVMIYRSSSGIVEDWDLPLFTTDDGRRFVEEILSAAE
ncbi:MAG TPA: tRNA(His) guanylyltransferase Thg1 family protein [Methanothrix sp.]|nr:tRNA(His) guanylyltransferase Thg1 family protein [Methanothrix sp.]HOK58564.1 tRNA(His) guanylyltransferase Thg1 family protein [Methanothrix sp.]HOL43733.1 tRNA(His) guanylyltransferase Thg1 family protein [Methanothrix sp.]HPO88709.1 tRNA(His) guanylyltransferase Thg1 family protein [Methanothrix sp.]